MRHAPSRHPGDLPHVVIIGGGFGGLGAAQALARAPVRITLLDRRNHHLFQPLLYQVATAALSPAQIAAPIRRVLASQKNAEVMLAEATAIDPVRRVVRAGDREIPYDYLIVASGATHSYFGHDEWAPHALGLKTIEDALEIRRRFLLAFERAELETDERERAALLTFVVVGAGPTGVELAGAMIEIACKSIPSDFRHVQTERTRVVLVEAQDRVLPGGFPEECSRRAEADLKNLGVELLLRTRVTHIDASGVVVAPAHASTSAIAGAPSPRRIDARTVLWAAGVQASPLGAMLGAPTDRSGRVVVSPDLSIPEHPEVFVVGDLAQVTDAASGKQVPGMCPGAMQMGKHVARIIRDEVRRSSPASAARRSSPAPSGGGGRVFEAGGGKNGMTTSAAPSSRPPFRYLDKGLLATIGRSRAVASLRGFNFAGFVAWALWGLVHILFLISFRAKVLVMLDWMWSYLWFERGSRLITGDVGSSSKAKSEK